MTSRARQIHQHLYDTRRACTLDELRHQVLPECTSIQTQSVINGLLKYAKIVRAKPRNGRNTYRAAPGVPVHRRNQIGPVSRREQHESARKTAFEKRQKKIAAVADKAAVAPRPAASPTNPHGGVHARNKADQSAQIAAEIAAFEARGGRIQVLRNGEASQPLKHIGADAEYLAARAKGRTTQQRRNSAA